jgi:hypothetical protein
VKDGQDRLANSACDMWMDPKAESYGVLLLNGGGFRVQEEATGTRDHITSLEGWPI